MRETFRICRSRPETGSSGCAETEADLRLTLVDSLARETPLKSTTLLIALIVGGLTDARSQTATDSPLDIVPAAEIVGALNTAPVREGPPPDTPDGVPHQQHSQNASLEMQDALMASIRVLPGVYVIETEFSLPGSLGWRLEPEFAMGPDEAFITTETLEFGHLHQPFDGSMHMLLPSELSAVALGKGWGVIHPLSASISGENSDYVMIFGPRNENELQTIWTIAQISYYQARGLSMEASSTSIAPATFGRIKHRTH